MKNAFAARIAELRKERGLSQKEAARQMGISQSLLSHYEKGIRECGLDFLCSAATFYGVTCDYILGRSNTKSGLSPEYLVSKNVVTHPRLNTTIVYQAAAYILEALNHGSEELGEQLLCIYSLGLHRLVIKAIEAGRLPESWVDHKSILHNELYIKMLDSFTNLVSALDDGAVYEIPDFLLEMEPPECVKTIENLIIRYIEKDVHAFLNCVHKES